MERFIGKSYNENQVKELLKVAKGTNIEAAILLSVHYGLRRSEVLGLKWDCVDFKENKILIKNTVVKMTTIVEKERTKNKSSYRTLPLIPIVMRYLRRLRVEQKLNKLMCGSCYNDNDYICKWEDGRPFHPDYVSRKFKKILISAELPIIRFHDLRHTAASILINMGYSLKEIQEWLGHNDIGTTANIYGHLEFQSKINMANSLGDKLNIKTSN